MRARLRRREHVDPAQFLRCFGNHRFAYGSLIVLQPPAASCCSVIAPFRFILLGSADRDRPNATEEVVTHLGETPIPRKIGEQERRRRFGRVTSRPKFSSMAESPLWAPRAEGPAIWRVPLAEEPTSRRSETGQRPTARTVSFYGPKRKCQCGSIMSASPQPRAAVSLSAPAQDGVSRP